MDLAEYLQSEQATEDVAMVIAEPKTISRNINGRCYVFMEQGAWRQLELCVRIGESDKFEVMRVYFRPEGDRYIVTDLGEGLRVLRLRTGHWCPDEYPIECMAEEAGCVFVRGQMTIKNPVAAELPNALCRVLLASYRVGQMAVS